MRLKHWFPICLVVSLSLLGCQKTQNNSGNSNTEISKKAPDSLSTYLAPPVVRVPPSKSNKRIRVLLTGDSMIGCLFFPLRKFDSLKRYQFIYSPWYGSTSKDWAKSDSLNSLIARYKPEYVFFTVGANELLYYSLKKRVTYYDIIKSKLGNTKYIFVGAPNWKPAEEYYQILKERIPEDQLFMSKDLLLARRKDKAHPTFEAGFIWTDSLCNWLQTKSKYQADFYFKSLKH
jgi:hypothetical protein